MARFFMFWYEDIPSQDGWYWIKYTGKHGKMICPCNVYHTTNDVVILTARNDTFTGKTRDCFGFRDAKFSSQIPFPED